jgi:hypothetical protein
MDVSWGLFVFDTEEALSDPETGRAVFPDDWQPPTIGDAKTVRAKISDAFSQVNWTDPTWGSVEGTDFSLEFNLGREDAISSFVIHARGQATPAILVLMSKTGWKILDTSTGKWLHEAANPDEGREAFQGYLNTVLETQATARKPTLLKRLFGW